MQAHRFPLVLGALLGVVLLSRVALTMVGVAVRDGRILAESPASFAAQPVSSHQWLNAWIAWDAGWYARIAVQGYAVHPATPLAQQAYAFSPLYPALIGSLALVVGHPYLIGLIISAIALLGVVILLWQYGRSELGDWRSADTVWYLLALPAAFIFSGVMSESLFLLLALGSIMAARSKRWWLAGLLGVLVSLTRPIGVFILLPLLVQAAAVYGWNLRRWSRSTCWLLLTPALFGLWLGTQFHLTGDAFMFLHVQADWRRHLTDPLHQLLTAVTAQNGYDRTLGWYIVGLLGILVALWKRMNPMERTYAWTFTLVPLASGWYSFTRYTIVVFPLAVGLARVRLPDWLKYSLLVCLAVVQVWLFIHWPLHTSLII